VYLRAPGYLAASAEAARAEAEASLMHYYRAQGALLSDSAGRAGVEQVDKRMKTAERLKTITFEEALRGSVMIGTPTDVAERIKALRDDMGLDGILLEINCGGKVPHLKEKEALRLLCQEVMPRVR
jgi:alkanesulfonate monooxygenase SsuD/methylene tetrahydromethanopterin reductase-like flavin-dependent oxidoreductase (luciferase family)